MKDGKPEYGVDYVGDGTKGYHDMKGNYLGGWLPASMFNVIEIDTRPVSIIEINPARNECPVCLRILTEYVEVISSWAAAPNKPIICECGQVLMLDKDLNITFLTNMLSKEERQLMARFKTVRGMRLPEHVHLID